MQAGLLNESIIWESPEIRPNEYGNGQETVWLTRARTRAKVELKGSDRTAENGEIVFLQSAVFTVRYYHNISEEDRIIYKSKPYRILGIEPRKAEQCKVITAQQIYE